MINNRNNIEFLFLSIVLITVVSFGFTITVKKIEEREEYRKTKCIQNELYYKENKDYVKQNKKCVIIDNEPYIYNNGNLERAY